MMTDKVVDLEAQVGVTKEPQHNALAEALGFVPHPNLRATYKMLCVRKNLPQNPDEADLLSDKMTRDFGSEGWEPSPDRRDSYNAESVNYIVLPDNRLNDSERFFRKMGFQLGDIAAVIHKGILQFALFADIGPMGKLREGSVRLGQALGVDPFIDGQVRVGIDEEVVYLAFPNSRPASLSPDNVNDKVALRLFKELGGTVSSSPPTA